jgi:hypothetical protein
VASGEKAREGRMKCHVLERLPQFKSRQTGHFFFPEATFSSRFVYGISSPKIYGLCLLFIASYSYNSYYTVLRDLDSCGMEAYNTAQWAKSSLFFNPGISLENFFKSQPKFPWTERTICRPVRHITYWYQVLRCTVSAPRFAFFYVLSAYYIALIRAI